MRSAYIAVVLASSALADAPLLFCRPTAHQRFIPACAQPPSSSLLGVAYLGGPSEANPVFPSAVAATRGWRVFDEVFRTFNGPVMWIDTFGSSCAANETFDPALRPDMAKLAIGNLAVATGNQPELLCDRRGNTGSGLGRRSALLLRGGRGRRNDSPRTRVRESVFLLSARPHRAGNLDP